MTSGFVERMNTLARRATHIAVVSVGKVKRGAEELRGRINIENSRQLKEAGFSVGTKFKVSYQPGFVEAVRDEQGSNTIVLKRFARRDGREVQGERFDLRSPQVHEHFAGEEKVLALYLADRIVFLHLPTVSRNLQRLERLKSALQRGKLRTAAFYSGLGTLDAALHDGFKKAGIETEVAMVNDSWGVAIDALLNDHPAARKATRTFTGGIEQFIASGARMSDVDLFVAGIPCKGASKLNVATSALPEMHPWAGHQVLNAVLALERMDFPPLVLFENVTAYANTVSLSMLRRLMEEQGYETQLVGDVADDGTYQGLDSTHYGDIERRRRMGLLGYPKGIKVTMQSMVKSGPSKLTVGDIRLPEAMVNPAEYEKGKHLNRQEKVDKGWRNRIVDNTANVTPSMSADCWKQRIEDPKFKHPEDASKCRLPLPEEHAALKGQDVSLINSLVANSHAHTALGNGAAKKVWMEFARALGTELRRQLPVLEAYLRKMTTIPAAAVLGQQSLFAELEFA
jgi:DNA (cytosine-5)-methyltransferase 1